MTAIPTGMKGGYVRVPNDWIYLPISPQAKMLLVAFCAKADAFGKSYCSYAQLGEIVQRGKGSISNYVRELRESGLIHCKQQKYGNGYNYRLLITLLGWEDLLAYWKSLADAKADRSRSKAHVEADAALDKDAVAIAQAPAEEPKIADQNTESRSQHAEHKDPSGPKNKIYKTQTPVVDWSKEDEDAWCRVRSDTDPIGTWQGKPCPQLLQKAIDRAEAVGSLLTSLPREEAKASCRAALRAFSSRRRLQVSEEHLAKCAETLAGVATTADAIEASMQALTSSWKPHWRKLSNPSQLLECCGEVAQKHSPSVELKAQVGRIQNRGWHASMKLAEFRATGKM